MNPDSAIGMTADDRIPPSRVLSTAAATGGPQLWWCVVPALVLFVVFFVVPLLMLLVMALDRPVPGLIGLTGDISFENFARIFTRATYYEAIFRSVGLAAATSMISLFFGYPLAYLIAKTEHPGWNTVLMIAVLSAMQLDMIIRLYGLTVMMGDKGLINGFLTYIGLPPLPLMYNAFGVIVGLVQVTLPFMVLSLVGAIRAVNPSLEEAGRSLGATRFQVFWQIILPLTMPGILAGSLLVFALSISSYSVPGIMGGWKVVVLPLHIYQQIIESGRWQFGAAVAAVLLAVSILAVLVYRGIASRASGGRA
jgi:putative spermidine/putrescine transport system permease protein